LLDVYASAAKVGVRSAASGRNSAPSCWKDDIVAEIPNCFLQKCSNRPNEDY
jgi:hypothetical protein